MRTVPFRIFFRLVMIILVMVSCLTVLTGCLNKPASPDISGLSALSLLGVRPLIGTDGESTDITITTSRVIIDENSVEGWLSPPENVLRFPLTIYDGAYLSVKLGVLGDVPDGSDIVFRINFLNSEFVTQSLFETSFRRNLTLAEKWLDINLPLSQLSPGNTELIFETTFTPENIPGLQILWGAPTIFYPENKHHRNVILIGIDALRSDSLSIYGGQSIVSPELEEFSQSATIFDQARSQSSWTLPSFASIITGGLPSAIGTSIQSGRIPDGAVTIGEMLRPHGYTTSTICGNTYLGNTQSGFHQGFDELWFRFSATPQAAVGRTIDFIERNRGRDWFCFLHIMDPHGPYTPRNKYADLLCDPDYHGPIGNAFHDADAWKSLASPPPPEDIQQVRDLYDAEVANVDSALGNLFMYIEEQNIADETLIIICSDHGEEFFDHGGFEHGHTHYEEMVHLPLLIKGLGFPAGERITNCVGNWDIVPTILSYTGITYDGHLNGIALQEISDNPNAGSRIILGEGNNRGTDRKYAVEWPYKCIFDFVTMESQLYNLAEDPGETTDLHESNPEIVARLSQAILYAMLPERTVFHIWFMGSPTEEPARFNGILKFSSGIEDVNSFGIGEGDLLEVGDDTITFDISNEVPVMGIDKHLTIFPSEDSVILEASVLVNGVVDPDHFFPYGTQTPEPSGTATIAIDKYPLGTNMPMDEMKLSPGMYIWGIMGFNREDIQSQMDPEALEQLRSLGYI